MEQYAGIDVSLESASICVVDSAGRIVREAKVACEPKALIAWFSKLGVSMTRRPGSGPAVTMAVCKDAGSGSVGRAVGDPPRPRRLQGDAGEDGSHGRTRY